MLNPSKINVLLYFIPIFISALIGNTYAGKIKFKLLTNINPPLIIKTENDKLSGIAVSIIHQMFKRANLKYEIYALPFARAIIETQNENYTCVFPLSRSQKRESLYKWVGPILITQDYFYGKKGSNIKLITLFDAKKYYIKTIRGDYTTAYLKDFNFTVNALKQVHQGLLMLEKGRADLFAGSSLTIDYYIKKIKCKQSKSFFPLKLI